MFASIRSRLWLTYLLIVGVVILITSAAVFLYILRNPAVDRSELQRLRLAAGLVARRGLILDEPTGQIPLARLEQIARRADAWLQARVLIFAPNGKLVIDSRAETAVPPPDLSFFIRKRLNAAPVFRDTQGIAWLYALAPLDNGNTLIVATVRPQRSVWNLFREEFLPPFLRALALALLLSLLLAAWMARWISAPLQKLAKATRLISTSQFQPVPPEGPAEVQEVWRSFNEMGQRLQASQRSQREFVANVSHDLKTPLTSIQGYAQAILDDITDHHSAAQVIYNEASRMYRMVLDLLDLARLDAGTLDFEWAPVDLNQLLSGVVQKFALQAQGSKIDLRLDLVQGSERQAPVFSGDADRLAQAFANLVDNALKFTPAGGNVRISARLAEGWIEVQIIDSGPGIPEEELPRIFERFYQVDKARRGGERRGVGLGLAIAREVIQAHGGTIQAANRGAGESGCVVTVRLPVQRPAQTSTSGHLASISRPG